MTAEGVIAKAEDRLREMLAACSTFQTWTSTESAAAAKERIHFDELPTASLSEESYPLSEAVSLRPYALIWTSETQGLTLNVVASPGCVSPSGMLLIWFVENIPDEYYNAYSTAAMLFRNTIGKIMQSESDSSPGLIELVRAGGSSHLDIHRLVFSGPFRGNEEEVPGMGDYHMCELEVHWGTPQ